MQYLAMLTMLADHIGAYLVPWADWLRVVGRVAFPVYLYLISRGMQRTRNRRMYLVRLGIIAAAAQVVYASMEIHHLNVVVTLMIGAAAIWATEKYIRFGLAAWVAAGIVCELAGSEYGLYGIALLAVYHYCRGVWMVMGHAAVTALAVYLGLMPTMQMWSMVAAALIAWWPQLDEVRAPAWLWRSFYPAHLAMLALIRYV